MSKFCSKCGEENVDNAKFCRNCGEILNAYNNNTPVTDEENDHTLIYVAGILLAIIFPLAGIIIGAYIYTRKDSSKASKRGMNVMGLSALVWIATVIFTMGIIR